MSTEKVEAQNEVTKPKAEVTKSTVETQSTKSTATKSTAKKPATKRAKYSATKIKAIAEQSWWRRTSAKSLAETNNLTIEQLGELRATPEYQKAVEKLMLGQRPEEADFDKWLESYNYNDGNTGARNMSKVFGGRMGLDHTVVPTMVKSVKASHGAIASGKAKAPKMIKDPHAKASK